MNERLHRIYDPLSGSGFAFLFGGRGGEETGSHQAFDGRGDPTQRYAGHPGGGAIVFPGILEIRSERSSDLEEREETWGGCMSFSEPSKSGLVEYSHFKNYGVLGICDSMESHHRVMEYSSTKR